LRPPLRNQLVNP